jgi:hypothetical protein
VPRSACDPGGTPVRGPAGETPGLLRRVRHNAVGMRRRKVFLKKENKKLFSIAGSTRLPATERPLGAIAKVFCFFFSKKKNFFCFSP